MNVMRIGVIGAGQMGAGIAQVSAAAGFLTTVTDTRNDALINGAKRVEKSLAKLETKSLISGKHEILQRISWHADLDRLRECDLVIEAVIENEQVKKEVLRSLDACLKEGAIIASNTSSISITRLAQATTRPERFMGMHFMNPVPLMKLVELIRGHHTSTDTVQAVSMVAEKMGKVCSVANDFPGFIANRILMPMINEAFFALMEGVTSAEDIDLTMKLGCNMPMGPLAVADLIGLDTCLAISEVIHRGIGDDKYRPCPLLRKYVEAGLWGRKTNQGVFSYSKD